MENIRLGRSGASDEDVRAAAKAAQCDEFRNRRPKNALLILKLLIFHCQMARLKQLFRLALLQKILLSELVPRYILFLLFAGRIYDPFTNCFMLLAEVFAALVSIGRMKWPD